MANVGLSLVEGVANGATAYKSPSKRNIGLLGQFIRGAALTPTKVNSLEEFNNIFGGQSSNFYGPGIVRSIFKEAGEAKVTLYVARVVGTGAVVASTDVVLEDNVTMSIRAGYKGTDDPGTWANGIRVNLYPYGSRIKDMFTLTVSYKGRVVETYNYASLSAVQIAVNKVSKYITIEFSGELSKTPTFTNIQGTAESLSRESNIVNGGSAARFTTALKVGDVLYMPSGAFEKIGTVASIVNDEQLLLESNSLIEVINAPLAKRNDSGWLGVLHGGVEGTVEEADFYPADSISQPKGLSCFRGYDVQILAVTEYHSLTMAKKFNSFLNEWKNPVGVINLPINADEGTAELYARELQTSDRSFLAGAYMGWGKVDDEQGNEQLLPIIGPVLGAAYLRTPYVQGDFIHIPPGGTDSMFKTVKEVVPARLSQSAINRCVQQFSCNIIQYVENEGYYVGSSRTYSTNDLYCSIHIRLQTSYYVRALNALMRFMEQKPNTPELKNSALRTLRRYFKNEYDNGALERSVPFDTAYQGICDQSNNPVGQDRKLINLDVLWIPTECTESIQLSLQRNDGVLNVTEV